MKFSQSSKSAEFARKLSSWSAKHPLLALLLVSLIAVAINCYPVIFCGKSFVAPAVGLPMVYEKYPTLPGMTNRDAVQTHGSDSGATLIWGVPLGFIQSRALLGHGELPLWNRYSHAGDTLIGQAISMFGDPLQWIVILGRGCALAHDIKFLTAKLLFALGFGLLIRRLTGNLPLALLFAALAPYCGAFYYIFNHPSFFVLSYTPWILLAALEFLNPQSPHFLRWGLLWLVVNFGCFNAGHIEPAVLFIGGLNFAALVFALASHRNLGASIKIIVRLASGTVLFLAITAPVWLSFLVSLKGAYTIHTTVHVTQCRFASMLAMFDDVFFRLPVHPGPFGAPAPGTSLLVFVGTAYSLIRWRTLKRDLFFWINTTAIFFYGGCVFEWVPSSLIALIPMVNRIGHTHTDFSYLLVIHLTIQCAYGFLCLAREPNLRSALIGLFSVALILAGLILLYCFGFEHGEIPWSYCRPVIAGAFAAPLLYALLKTRSPIPLAGWAVIILLGFIPQFRFGLYTFGNEFLVMAPKPRVTLNAPSPAIDTIKADHSSPFRVAAAQEILYGDYAAVYELEGINSCAPVSNQEFVRLVRGTPGVLAATEWDLALTNIISAHPLLNLLNVKYILTPEYVELQDGLGYRLATRSDLGVLENLDVWPRAFFSDAIVSAASTEDVVNHLLSHPKQPFAALAPDEIAAHPELSPLLANTNSTVVAATNFQLLPNSTAFDIRAPAAGIVCLTEGKAEDFFATANGQPKTVLAINRAFKGIYLDKPGDYRIQFTYRPRYWRLACILFCTAMGIIAILAIVSIRPGKFKEVEDSPNPDIPTP